MMIQSDAPNETTELDFYLLNLLIDCFHDKT